MLFHRKILIFIGFMFGCLQIKCRKKVQDFVGKTGRRIYACQIFKPPRNESRLLQQFPPGACFRCFAGVKLSGGDLKQRFLNRLPVLANHVYLIFIGYRDYYCGAGMQHNIPSGGPIPREPHLDGLHSYYIPPIYTFFIYRLFVIAICATGLFRLKACGLHACNIRLLRFQVFYLGYGHLIASCIVFIIRMAFDLDPIDYVIFVEIIQFDP